MKDFSTGMKQRLLVARALLNAPAWAVLGFAVLARYASRREV